MSHYGGVLLAILLLGRWQDGRPDRLTQRPIPATGDLVELINELTQQMHAAAEDLHFELAARLRDEIQDLKKELRAMRAAQ